MQSLDVKFVVHHGEFIRQKMSGREELAGRDVILVHRLLKNDVGKTWPARMLARGNAAAAVVLEHGLKERVTIVEFPKLGEGFSGARLSRL